MSTLRLTCASFSAVAGPTAQSRGPSRTRRRRRFRSALHESTSTAFALVKTIQSKAFAVRRPLQQRPPVVRRQDADHRRLDRLGPERREQVRRAPRLFSRGVTRTRCAEQRPRVEPAQVFPQPGHPADDEDGRPRGARSFSSVARSSAMRARASSLRRQRAVIDERRLAVGASRARLQRLEDPRQLLRPGVADDRPVEGARLPPVDVGRRPALVLEAATNVMVSPPPGRSRHAGVGRHADAGGHAGHDFEAMPCSCRKSASSPPWSNTNGSPHLRRATILPSRAFSARVADRLLRHGLRCRCADVDQFHALSCVLQELGGNPVVVDDDIRRLKAFEAVHRDQARVARSGADQVDRATPHEFGRSIAMPAVSASARMSAAPCASNCSAACAPRRAADAAAPRVSARTVRWPSIDTTMVFSVN